MPRAAAGGDRAAKEAGRYKGRAPTARAKAAEIRKLAAEGCSTEIARRLGVGGARYIGCCQRRAERAGVNSPDVALSSTKFEARTVLSAFACSANRSKGAVARPAKSPKPNSVAACLSSAVETGSCGRMGRYQTGCNK